MYFEEFKKSKAKDVSKDKSQLEEEIESKSASIIGQSDIASPMRYDLISPVTVDRGPPLGKFESKKSVSQTNLLSS